MERLREEIAKRHITDASWNHGVSLEALRRVLEETGSIEGEELKVEPMIGRFGATLVGVMSLGALRVRILVGIRFSSSALAQELAANSVIKELDLAFSCVCEDSARHHLNAGALRANGTVQL